MFDFKPPPVNQIICQERDIPLLRINKHATRQNTPEDKRALMAELRTRYVAANQQPKKSVGLKSLVYYALGGSKDYLSLAYASLDSLNKHCPKPNFEVLFICPLSWRYELAAHPFAARTAFHFHVVKDSEDGVEVSKNKCRIFEFSRLDEYRNVLFLDADILAVRDISFLFDQQINPSILHVKCNEKPSIHLYTTVYHGLRMFTRAEIMKLEEKKRFAFNAGQFLFVNTPYMRAHFDNVLWLMKEWPGYYFFEQSFLCQYFCGYDMATDELLQTKVLLVSARNDEVNNSLKNLTSQHCLIHFIAPALEPEVKAKFIAEQARDIIQS